MWRKPLSHQSEDPKSLDESEAHFILAANFREEGGLYQPRHGGYQITERERAALDYLITEWDYDYNPTPISNS